MTRRKEETVVGRSRSSGCLASWWLGGAGAGALLYRLSIGFGAGCKPGQKRKKISGCRHLFVLNSGHDEASFQ